MMQDSLGIKQQIQEDEYDFPYHYIPTLQSGRFSQMKYWIWGFHYLSATQYLVQRLCDLSFESLVDVGCGDGRFLHDIYASFPDKKLMGIDYSERSILFARAFCPQVKFVVQDITVRAVDADQFDVATCIEVLEHIPLDVLPKFVAALWHLVKPSGDLIVTVPSTNKRLNPKHYQHFDSHKLKRVLAPYFEVQEFVFFDRFKYSVQLVKYLVHNRFYSLTWQILLDKLYGLYVKRCFFASEDDAGRIAAFCRRLD